MSRGTEGPPRRLLEPAVLGFATGLRSTVGLLLPLATRPTASERTVVPAAIATVGELIADKLPRTPSRLQPPSLAVRAAAAAGGARLLASPHGAGAAGTAVAVAGALLGSWAGARWRRVAAQRVPDVVAAVAEDAAAFGLAAWACRGRLRRPGTDR